MEGLEADKRKRTSEEESAEEISKRTANLKKKLWDWQQNSSGLLAIYVLSKSPPEQNKKRRKAIRIMWFLQAHKVSQSPSAVLCSPSFNTLSAKCARGRCNHIPACGAAGPVGSAGWHMQSCAHSAEQGNSTDWLAQRSLEIFTLPYLVVMSFNNWTVLSA